MSIPAPVPTSGSTTQASDQSSVSFNDSLLTASKAYSEVGSAASAGPKATFQTKPASEDAKTSEAVPASTTIQSPVVTQLTGSQQQALPTQQAQLASAANSPTELSLAEPSAFSDAATTVLGQLNGNSKAGWTAGTKSTIAQSGVVKSTGNLSKNSQSGSTHLASVPISSSSTIESVKPLPVAPSTTGNSVTDGLATASSIADRSVIQDSLPNGNSEESANSLPLSALNSVASVAPNASPNAGSNTIRTGASDAQSNATTNGIQIPLFNVAANVAPNSTSNQLLNQFQTANSDAQSNATSNGVQNPPPNALPEKAENSSTQSALNAALNASNNAVQNPVQIVGPDPQSNTVPNAIPSPMPNAVPVEAQNSLSQSALNAFASVAPIASSIAASNQAPVAASTAASNELQTSLLKSALKAFASIIPNGLTNAAPNAAAHAMANNGLNPDMSDVHNAVANTVHNEVPSVAVNAATTTPLNADSTSIAHAAQPALTKDGAGQVASSVSKNPSITPVASPDQTMPATSPSVPETVTAQPAAQNLFTDGSPVASQSGLTGLNSTSAAKLSAVSSANGKAGSTDDADEATELKQHAPSNLSTFQSNNQEATGSANQSQVSTSSQAQGTPASLANFSSHAVVDSTHAQSATITSPVQNSPTPGGNAGHASSTPNTAAPAATAAPQASPVVNTARLIQNVGQSEMRVGMRSNEFGNISISTSATRDSVSAQISLDHGELAKTLTAHLPEIQAKLSTNQSVDVRIDTNGARGGLEAGASGTFSDGATSDSRGSRQQAGNAASSYSGNGFSNQQFSPAASTVTTGEGGLSARLDIRV